LAERFAFGLLLFNQQSAINNQHFQGNNLPELFLFEPGRNFEIRSRD